MTCSVLTDQRTRIETAQLDGGSQQLEICCTGSTPRSGAAGVERSTQSPSGSRAGRTSRTVIPHSAVSSTYIVSDVRERRGWNVQLAEAGLHAETVGRGGLHRALPAEEGARPGQVRGRLPGKQI